jgi:hypothetical protein
LLLAAGLMLALPATAQTPAEDIAERIGKFARQLPANLEAVGDLWNGELADDASTSFTLDIDPRRSYLVIADCHLSCNRVNVSVLNDEDGSNIRDSEDRNGLSVAYINPLAASKVRIKVTMVDCTKPACVWGAAVVVEAK